MKLILTVLIYISLFTVACGPDRPRTDERKVANAERIVPVVANVTPTPDRPVSNNTPVPTPKKSEPRVVREIRTRLSSTDKKLQMFIDSERLFVRSSILNDFQLLIILRDYFERLHDAGFDRIEIVDKDGSRRDVNLAILQ